MEPSNTMSQQVHVQSGASLHPEQWGARIRDEQHGSTAREEHLVNEQENPPNQERKNGPEEIHAENKKRRRRDMGRNEWRYLNISPTGFARLINQAAPRQAKERGTRGHKDEIHEELDKHGLQPLTR